MRASSRLKPVPLVDRLHSMGLALSNVGLALAVKASKAPQTTDDDTP
jgi:hypothetical protein